MRERGELLIIKWRDEQVRHPTQMDRRGLGQAGDAGLGQRDHDATSVCVGVGAKNEAFTNQPGDTASHARP